MTQLREALQLQGPSLTLQRAAADEIARLDAALKWEQSRAERIGTHGLGCHTWGPSHYECLLREHQALVQQLKP